MPLGEPDYSRPCYAKCNQSLSLPDPLLFVQMLSMQGKLANPSISLLSLPSVPVPAVLSIRWFILVIERTVTKLDGGVQSGWQQTILFGFAAFFC